MRITATALGVVGTGLVAAAVLMLVLLQITMRDNVDAQARLRLVEIVDLVRNDRLPSSLAGEDDGTVAQVVVNDVVVAQSPTIHGNRPIAAFIPAGTDMTIRTVRNPPISDGEAYRIAVQRVDSPRGPAVVYTAATLEPVQDTTKAAFGRCAPLGNSPRLAASLAARRPRRRATSAGHDDAQRPAGQAERWTSSCTPAAPTQSGPPSAAAASRRWRISARSLWRRMKNLIAVPVRTLPGIARVRSTP
ncbi:hypothetical protein [Dactylosporangium darangshiense]|uniref:hypothetical protein n=1 Tax=Dactylosporangium darangshiense TaxID=579108 RepID=UPI00363916FF